MASEYSYIPLVTVSEAKKRLAVRERTSVNCRPGPLFEIRRYEEMEERHMHEYMPPVSRWAYSMSIPYEEVPKVAPRIGENRIYEYVTGIHVRKFRRVRKSVTHNKYEVKERLSDDTARLDGLIVDGGAAAIPMYPANPVLSEDVLRMRNSAVRVMRAMRIKRQHVFSFIVLGIAAMMLISVLSVKAETARLNFDNNRIMEEMEELKSDIDEAKLGISFAGNIQHIQERAAELGMTDSLDTQIVDIE